MSSYISYFTPASWKQAQKNKSDLEATNPTNPVLNDEDEQFLERITTQEGPAPPLPERPTPTAIEDDGQEKEINKGEEAGKDDIVIPAATATSSAGEGTQEERGEKAENADADKPATEDKDEESKIAEVEKDNVEEEMHGGEETLGKKSDGNDEETGGKSEEKDDDQTEDKSEDKMTKSWASYLPSIPSLTKKKDSTTPAEPKEEDKSTSDAPTEAPAPASPKAKKTKKNLFPTQEEAEAATAAGTKELPTVEGEAVNTGRQTEDVSNTRTWSSYIPNIPATLSRSTPQEQASASLASAASSIRKGKAAEEAGDTTEDEKEVSVLLDRLNLSAINNRVFSFSNESQKVYQSFTVVLKDIIAGGPTAYDDLEKLIEENKEQLEKMFGNMPPFVQTLVKSLPAKFATTLGPEVMAAMSEKPGNDLKAMEAAHASSSSASASGLKIPEGKKKQKRKIPGIKSLVSEKGAVASMLRSILNFLKLRFPAFVTGTNVLMSLAVFILLFVFWYCHKRGKETRLLAEEREKTSAEGSGADESDLEASTVLDEKPEVTEDPWMQDKEKDTGETATEQGDEELLHGPEHAEGTGRNIEELADELDVVADDPKISSSEGPETTK